MRIVNKYKFIRSSVITIMLLFAIFNVSIARAEANKTVSYTVCKGDTLWSIAQEYKQEHDDIRQYIHDLKKLNNLTSSNIYEGQTIQIRKGL